MQANNTKWVYDFVYRYRDASYDSLKIVACVFHAGNEDNPACLYNCLDKLHDEGLAFKLSPMFNSCLEAQTHFYENYRKDMVDGLD